MEEYKKLVESVQSITFDDLCKNLKKIEPYTERTGTVFEIYKDDKVIKLRSYPNANNWSELNELIDHLLIEQNTENFIVVQNFSGVLEVSINYEKVGQIFRQENGTSNIVLFADGTKPVPTSPFILEEVIGIIKGHFSDKTPSESQHSN